MKKSLFLSFAILLAALPLFAQQPKPTPPLVDDQVVRINTDLIQLDVTVLDKDGKVVTNLRPEDFELYENGKAQKIANFSFVSKLVGGASTNGDSTNSVSTTTGSVPLKRGDVRRTIALVVDDMNLSFASVYYTRKALLKFVNEQMQQGDLVAVIRTGGAVGALQQFTSDKTVLRTAIEKIRWSPFSNIDALTSIAQTDTEITDKFSRESDQLLLGKQNTVVHPHDNVDQIQKQSLNASRNTAMSARAIYTQSSLGTLRYVISGMKELPGRKAMMVFSDGIDIGDEANNKSRAPAIWDFLQGVTETANRSSVTIYTFDARGMQTATITASDSVYEVIDGHRTQKVKQRDRDFRDAQDGLAYLANQTGGKALLNSNDLNAGIDRALNEQAGYYLLGYVPDAETFEPGKRKFNKFEIRVKQPNLKVSYRSGFFNSELPEQRPEVDADKAIATSLTSPFAENAITLGVNALYANDPTSGPYIRSFLHIDARDLSFSDTADGWKTSTFDVAAVAFGNNGVPVDHIHTTYTIKSKGATYDAMIKSGFVYVLILPIKNPGVYQYRVALRDSASGNIGTASQVVGVPDLSKQRLTMSSLAVENVSIPTWQLITQGKIGNGTGQSQLKSTLLYDTVLRQFIPNTVLRYGFEVYNARADGGRGFHFETQANIVQNDKIVAEGNLNKLDLTDTASVPRVSGAITLGDKLAPGEYVLEITLRDLVTKQVTKQVFPFQIV